MPIPSQNNIIFVIDDDASVRKSLARLLSSAGFHVETFPSAEAFLERQPHQGIACIILDVCMQGLSGTELHVRLAESHCDIPIIFLTARDATEDKVRGLELGARLPRPVEARLSQGRRMARCSRLRGSVAGGRAQWPFQCRGSAQAAGPLSARQGAARDDAP